MGEARQRSRSRAKILAGDARCIYCESPATTIEHMPPVAMFKNRQRLSGFEFPACLECNTATRAADAAACFFARISPQQFAPKWEIDEAYKLVGTLARLAPSFIGELFDERVTSRIWMKGRDPVATPKTSIVLNGPVTRALMQAFTAKLGMALYAEHIGAPLPNGGAVFTKFFFNHGLTRGEAEATLQILPVMGQMRMGRQSSGRQFNYRYNTDDRSIIFAFAAFHDNLFTRAVAVSNPDTYRATLTGDYNEAEVQLSEITTLASIWNDRTQQPSAA